MLFRSPDAFRLATRLDYTELLLSGCTTAGDHHYLFPRGLEAAVDIQVEEARSLGIRAFVTRGSMSLSQDEGGLPPKALVQDDDTILADSERVLRLFTRERWLDRCEALYAALRAGDASSPFPASRAAP